MSFRLRDLQIKLQGKGYYQGSADGLWGPLTRKALEAWGPSGTDLDAPTLPIEPGNVIPPSWLPVCRMSRVVVHWTAGGPNVSAVDREHYHIIIDQELKLHRGDESISDNVNTADGDYAAHTRGLNTGSIGVALTGMLNARESPFDPGPYPIKLDQWKLGARVVAELVKFYEIPLTPTTVLQHGEVQARLGIPQAGKWDIMKLPWDPTLPPSQVANLFRVEVQKHL
jgi:hypothetical protein